MQAAVLAYYANPNLFKQLKTWLNSDYGVPSLARGKEDALLSD